MTGKEHEIMGEALAYRLILAGRVSALGGDENPEAVELRKEFEAEASRITEELGKLPRALPVRAVSAARFRLAAVGRYLAAAGPDEKTLVSDYDIGTADAAAEADRAGTLAALLRAGKVEK